MLYQLIRPKSLEEVVGNLTTIKALEELIKRPSEQRSHAILFHGPSGCGKTTLARILAKEFGSHDSGVIELNAANTRGIDTIREVASDVHLRGLGSSVKTHIFDEAHQITPSAQEALLKVIEDGPAHCYFILSTTEPEKIIKTVRNRCSEYEVGILSSEKILELLSKATEKLDIDVKNEVLEAISYTCEGCPRTALVQLEQVIGIEDVNEALELLVRGSERDANIIDLCKMLLMTSELREKKWKKIITMVSLLNDDTEKIRKSILTFLFNSLKKVNDVEDAKDITHLLKIFSQSTYYGGKGQLGALVAQACFEKG